MATVQLGAVIDALVAAMRATAGYRSPLVDATGIVVFDGIELNQTEEYATQWLTIGWVDPDTQTPAGDYTQDRAASAVGRPVEEVGNIICRAVWQSGDRDAKAARDGVLAIVRGVETACRSNPALGVNWAASGVPSLVAFIEQGDLMQGQAEGAVAEMAFRVTYTARIA
jgi:hypothetical protein